MAQITYYAPAGVTSINLSDGSRAVVVDGQITVDSKFRNELEAAGCSANAETDNAVRFTKTLTGGSKFFIGGKEQVLALPPFAAAMKWFGSQINNASYNQTTSLSALAGSYGIKLEAEADFDAVRLVWINRAANAINNCTALVGVSETAATNTNNNISQPVIGGTAYGQLAAAGSINGWRSVTWGGASSVNVAAANAAQQYAVSDWIPLSSIPRTDGGTRPLLMIRGQHDGSTDGNFAFLPTGSCASNRTANAANRGRIVQTCAPTAGVSTPANAAGLGTAAFEIFPIFRYRKPAITVMVAGDSTEQNDAIAYNYLTSWGWRGCADASTANRPVNYMNVGCSSKNSDEYWLRAQELINAGVVPDVLCIGPASVNDTYTSNTDRVFETARARVVEIIEFAHAKGIKRVLFIPLLPYNSTNSTTDAARVAFNSYLATLAQYTPGVAVLDFSALGDGASPERWKTAMNDKTAWQHVLFSTVKVAADSTSYVGATTYTATVTIDGTACAISFLGSDAATFATLVSVLNAQINTGMGTSGVTYVTLESGNLLIRSGTAGASSTVSVTAGTVFASPLAGFSSVPASMASAGSADGVHPNEVAIDTVMAPALTAYIDAQQF